MNDQNSNVLPKFRFFTKTSIIDQNYDFRLQFRLLTITSIINFIKANSRDIRLNISYFVRNIARKVEFFIDLQQYSNNKYIFNDTNDFCYTVPNCYDLLKNA